MEFLLILILGFYVASLSRRVRDLERRGDSSPAPAPTPQNLYSSEPFPLAPIPAPIAEAGMPSPIPPSSPAENGLIDWIKKDFMVKLGAFLLLLACGWFVSYAFANNWIGPWGRIIAGVASGALVFALGVYRMRTHVEQGAIFATLGSTIVIMSVYAAREIYGFFSPTTALALMGATVVLTAALSVRHRLAGLAMASLIMGAVAPLFTASPEPNLFGLSLYLLMLVVGTLWVMFLIAAPALTTVTIAMVSLYSLPYLSYVNEFERMQGLLFAFAFTACFLVGNILSLLRHEGEAAKNSHILSGLGTGLYLFFWIYGATEGLFENMLYLAFMVVFLLGGFFVYARTARSTALYIYGAVAVGYLAAVTANLFDGAALTMVYAVELAALIVATRFIPVDRMARKTLAWLYVPLVAVSLEHMFSSNWYDSVMHRDFGALLIVTVSLVVSGISLRLGREEQQHLKASGILLGTAGLYVLAQIALVLHALLEDNLAMTLTLALFGGIGTIVYCMGARLSSVVLQKAGMYVATAHIVLVFVSFNHIFSSAWETGVLHTDSLALMFVTALLWLTGVATLQPSVRQQTTFPARVLLTMAGAYSLTMVWLLLHALFTDGVATTISLISYTIVGLGLYMSGKQMMHPYIMKVGGFVIGGVILRLLFVEVWSLSVTMRIITFFVIGVLLISTAFIGRKKE